MDNTVESDQVHAQKTRKQGRGLDENFFYNQPIMDFALPDGTVGTLKQTPRKWKQRPYCPLCANVNVREYTHI